MQKSISKKDELKREIKLDSYRLKEKIEKLQAIDLTLVKKKAEKEVMKKKLEKSPIPVISASRFDEIVYRFACPDCKSKRTKRFGLTTQRVPKARFVCLNCQEKWRANENVRRVFFTLSNDDIKNIIGNDSSLTKEKKDFFLDRYLINNKK